MWWLKFADFKDCVESLKSFFAFQNRILHEHNFKCEYHGNNLVTYGVPSMAYDCFTHLCNNVIVCSTSNEVVFWQT